MKTAKLISAGAVLIWAAGLSGLRAQAIYTSGHADIGAGYDDVAKEFEPHWHLHANALVDGVPLPDESEYAPGDLIASGSATRTSPNGLSGILGVADGTQIYAMGSSAYQPNLGFGVEELDSDDWVGGITLTLTGWTTPSGAHFALYTTNLAGTDVVDSIFSSYDAGATDFGNTFEMIPGDHLHFQWAFTQAGTYTFEFTWTGTHVTDGAISASDSFSVQVVPEPATVALAVIGALAIFAAGRARGRASRV